LNHLLVRGDGWPILLAVGTLLLVAAYASRGWLTRTPSAALSPSQLNKAEAEWIDPRRLMADPAAYHERHIALYGKAQTVEQRGDYTWLKLLAQPPGGTRIQAVIVELRPPDREISDDKCYALYGIGADTQPLPGTPAGIQDGLPFVRAYAWDPSPPTPSGTACAP
jgi:hypothetical protein